MLLLSLLVVDAFACSAEDYAPPEGVEVTGTVGWSAEGRWFAFTALRHDGEGGSSEAGGVFDTRTDAIEILDGAAFAAWRDAHPLAPARGGDRCDGVTAIRRVDELSEFPGEEAVTTLGVAVGGSTWVHAELPGSQRIEPSWSPGCRHVAWVFAGRQLDHASSEAVGPWSPPGALLVRPIGPVVHIMAHKTARDTVDPVFHALTSAGFAPHVGPNAMKDRDATVVYASRAARDAAAKIAAAVPGGATVEPLDWPTAADVVVAAGRSALP